MAKIFQLELFIKEMSIWKLPHASEDHDETCVEVTVFDNQNVPINGYVFGKNSTMIRGQNFRFTLNATPDANESKVFFNVFKKAYNREKKFLGSGNIPIDKIFGDLLSQVFKDANTTKPSQNQSTANVSPTNDPQVASVTPTIDPSPLKKNPSQTKANTQEASKRNISQDKSASKGSLKAVDQKQGENTDSQVPQQNASQSEANALSSSKHSPQNAHVNPAQVGSTNIPRVMDPQANIFPIKNLKTVNIAGSAQGSPISSLSKDVYPIIGCDSKQWGTICILMRLTCFGYFSAHPILIHQNHKEIILQNTPNSATFKCVPLDNLRNNNRKGTDIRRQRQPINYCTDVANTCNSSSTSSAGSTGSSSSTIDTARTYSNLCPGPPASPSGQYEEFTAEINDNILCVRMPKNVGIVRRVYDSEPSKRMGSLHGIRQNTYSEHVRKIPIVRGNQKYPAHYGSIPSLPSDNVSMFDQRQRTQDPICDDDNISCPSNVQIVRTNNDPKRDVFLLKIGKDTRSGSAGIQLEMKTPKNPLAKSSTNKQTTSVQTYDDEFVSGINKVAKKGGGGKKGRK